MRKQSRILSVILPVAFGIVVLLLWQGNALHALLRLAPYELPVPSQIADALSDNIHVIMKHTRCTAIESLIGLCIGSAIGFVVAAVATIFSKWGKGGLTLISAFNAIPIIALAPVMNNWFGMGMGSKIAVVALFTMATMAINVYRGLNVLKPFSQDLMLSYAASKAQIFLKLRLPNSLPNIMTALKICSTSSIIAAIISEFFSSFQGIGFEMSSALKLADMPLAWAYILVAAVFGILMYCIILLVERYALFWHTSQR